MNNSDNDDIDTQCGLESDSDTNDDYNAGPEYIKTFCYRHFIIIIIPNLVEGRPNMVFMKATYLYIKG